MGAVWLKAPDEPVTVKVVWDERGALALLPPHPRVNSVVRRSKPSTLIPTKCLRVNCFLPRVVSRVPNNPRPGSRAAV